MRVTKVNQNNYPRVSSADRGWLRKQIGITVQGLQYRSELPRYRQRRVIKVNWNCPRCSSADKCELPRYRHGRVTTVNWNCSRCLSNSVDRGELPRYTWRRVTKMQTEASYQVKLELSNVFQCRQRRVTKVNWNNCRRGFSADRGDLSRNIGTTVQGFLVQTEANY